MGQPSILAQIAAPLCLLSWLLPSHYQTIQLKLLEKVNASIMQTQMIVPTPSALLSIAIP
jgi:hypothetical protein